MTKSEEPLKSLRDEAFDEAFNAYCREHYKKAVRLLTPLAENGDVTSQLLLYRIFGNYNLDSATAMT